MGYFCGYPWQWSFFTELGLGRIESVGWMASFTLGFMGWRDNGGGDPGFTQNNAISPSVFWLSGLHSKRTSGRLATACLIRDVHCSSGYLLASTWRGGSALGARCGR